MRMSARVPRTIDESALGWLFEADGELSPRLKAAQLVSISG
jgi:hypothetical protein